MKGTREHKALEEKEMIIVLPTCPVAGFPIDLEFFT